jgi:hypothetical protein
MINKYRIFDKQNREYCDEPDYRWMLSRNGKLYNSENDEWYTTGERYLVEFSTGIFDANNVEIFEGDKFSDGENDGSYYLIEYDYELSKFSVNHYSYNMSFNEGGGEVFDSEISLIDKNIIEVFDLREDYIIGNINLLNVKNYE